MFYIIPFFFAIALSLYWILIAKENTLLDRVIYNLLSKIKSKRVLFLLMLLRAFVMIPLILFFCFFYGVNWGILGKCIVFMSIVILYCMPQVVSSAAKKVLEDMGTV